MHYDLVVFLSRFDKYNWTLRTDKGVSLLDFKSDSLLEAEALARQFLSSWKSVNLIIKNEEVK